MFPLFLGLGNLAQGAMRLSKGNGCCLKGTNPEICFFKINARKQQQKAIRKWVTFPSSKHKKYPVLWNSKSRSRPSSQWLPSKASLVRHSSSLCLVTNGHFDGGITSSSICTYITRQSPPPTLTSLHPIHLFIPRYTEKIWHLLLCGLWNAKQINSQG